MKIDPTPAPPHPKSGMEREILEEIADPENWNNFLMWPGPAAKVITQWIGKPGIRERARKALASTSSAYQEEGKK